ncbi:type III secretion system translocon subunit SctE [Symbiopectobacterium purcellii]|uniref:type III secretion system translocon subunit SctE n=1 Tax=Symbiopectobacterium purcellii TaxID=2871826 RepID=UPI003F85A96D
MDVSKTGKAINLANFPSNTGKVSEAISTKTHISQVKGKAIDQLAQQRAREMIADDVSAQTASATSENVELPAIRQSTPLTSKAQMLFLMAQYQDITNGMDATQRANALAVFLTQSEARLDKARELSADLDALHQTFDGLEAEFNEAQKGVDGATDDVTQAQRKLDEAQKSLDELLEQLGVTDPDDPSLADNPDVTQAKKDITDAQKALGHAQSTLSDARAVAEQKLAAMQRVLNDINTNTAEMNKKYNDVDLTSKGSVVSSNSLAQSEKALTKTAVMIMLITEFIMKMEEASAEKLKNDLELNRIQTKARQAEMQRKSDKYEEQVRKAEEAQKMSSCVGKILGGLAIALGAITTVFGGGGLALMAVGIALMVADPIVAAITGKSLTEMVMNPLMEHVFMPLMNILGDIITQIFDKTPLGLLLNDIDKATGANMMDTIHMVVTAAVSIAAMVVISLVAKTAAKFMIEKMSQAMTSAIMQSIKQAITRVINKIMPQMVNNSMRQGSAALSRSMQSVIKQVGKVTQEINKKLDKISDKVNANVMKILRSNDPEDAKRLGNIALKRLEMLENGVQTAMPVVQSGMSINISNIRLQATKAIADFNLAAMDVSILRDLISKILTNYEEDSKASQSVNMTLSDMLSSKANTGKSVVRNIRA